MAKFTKRQVVDAQIEGAVILVSQENCIVPAHTLIMALEEIIRTMYVRKGIDTPYDYRKLIKPEYQEEYLRRIRANYNAFKHADRDLDAEIEIDEAKLHFSNVLDLSLQVMAYHSLFNELTPPMQVFFQWFSVSYPEYIKWHLTDTPVDVRETINKLGAGSPENKRAALRVQLTRADVLPRRDVGYFLHKGRVD